MIHTMPTMRILILKLLNMTSIYKAKKKKELLIINTHRQTSKLVT